MSTILIGTLDQCQISQFLCGRRRQRAHLPVGERSHLGRKDEARRDDPLMDIHHVNLPPPTLIVFHKSHCHRYHIHPFATLANARAFRINHSITSAQRLKRAFDDFQTTSKCSRILLHARNATRHKGTCTCEATVDMLCAVSSEDPSSQDVEPVGQVALVELVERLLGNDA
ncbi:hypothetical protein BC567DRAFT_229246 [Phyllosticta citribraziliensis]